MVDGLNHRLDLPACGRPSGVGEIQIRADGAPHLTQAGPGRSPSLAPWPAATMPLTAGALPRSQAPVATEARKPTRASPPSGVPDQLSPPSTGASSTGTQIWTMKTIGTTCV